MLVGQFMAKTLGDNKPSMKQKFINQADTEQMNSPIRGNIDILIFLGNVK